MFLLFLEDGGSFEFAGFGDDGFGTDEERSHNNLVAENEIIDNQVMSVDLPSPRFRGTGFAHDGDPIEQLVILVEIVVVEFAEGTVEVHNVLRQL